VNAPRRWRCGGLSDRPFVPPREPRPTAGSPLREPGDDGVSPGRQRGIETLETMLFIDAVYRRYFGDDPAVASPGRPADG
jgi:hypothetical protein